MHNLKRFVPALAVLAVMLLASVAGIAAEKAKSYSFSVNTATKVGTQVLTPGDYKVKFEGSNAVFTKESTRASVTTPAKLESGNDTYDTTVVHKVDDSGQPRITAIELKGTKDLLKLN